ncbi:MAG: LysR substrate-binding domain-containing protein [Pseudomonadota bacterium]
MRKLPPLAAIRAFEAAARHGNYTRAGEELGLTQAGVSYQIKALEERVGEILFVRQGRVMELTPAGSALAPRLTEAFVTMERAFEALQRAEESVLVIACFQTFATKILAPRLGSFQLAHPEIAIRLDVSDKYSDLEAGECDVAIRLSRNVPANLRSHELMPLRLAPFTSPSVASRIGEVEDIKPIIQVHDRISPNSQWWRYWDKAIGLNDGHLDDGSPRGGLQFDYMMLDAEAAMSGNGVAILAPPLFNQEVKEGRLVQLGNHMAQPERAFRLLYPEIRRHSHKVRAFRSWLMEQMAEHLGDNPGGLPDQR